LLPEETFSSSPVAATSPLTSTCARRSSRRPTSSLFFRPIHAFVGPTNVSIRLTVYITVSLDWLPAASAAFTTNVLLPIEEVSSGAPLTTVPAHEAGPAPPSAQAYDAAMLSFNG